MSETKESESVQEVQESSPKEISISHTQAKKLREKKPRTEAQIAATARLVEATKARREQAKQKRAQEEQARVEAEEARKKAEEEKAVAAAKIVVKPKRTYTRKPKTPSHGCRDVPSESEEEEESEEEPDEVPEVKVPPKKVMKKVIAAKEALEQINKTLESSNQYEALLRKKGII